MNYAKLIKDAWTITRKNQKLVWIGALPVVVILFNYNYSALAMVYPGMTIPKIFSTTFIVELQKIILSIAGERAYSLNLGVFMGTLFLYALGFGLGAISTSAFLYGLRIIREGETPTYTAIFERAKQNFKTFLMWSILSTVVMSLFSLLMFMMNIFQSLALSCMSLLVFYPLQMVVFFLTLMIPILIALEDRSISSAIQSAWNDFLKPHFWKAVLAYLLSGVVSVGLVIGVVLTCIPLFIILYLFRTDGITSFTLFFIMLLAYLPILTAGYGFLMVFLDSFWMSFYDQIKAIDKAKEEAAAFDGEVEVDVEETEKTESNHQVQ